MNKTHYPRLQETLYSTVLPSGLKLLVAVKPGFAAKCATIMTDFGSIHLEFTRNGRRHTLPQGIAHYLEHTLFAMPGDRDVAAEFAALGGRVNAYTSFDRTAYYFSCEEHFEENLRLLLEFVSTPWFTEEAVEKERAIIGQEIHMHADEPASLAFESLMGGLYRHHPIRFPILGSLESIAAITPALLEECHRAFYHPRNMSLCVVGDVDPEQVERIAGEYFRQPEPEMGKKLPFTPEQVGVIREYGEEKSDIFMPQFCLGIRCGPLARDDFRGEMVGDMAGELLMGEASGLYAQLYSQGVLDSSYDGGFETLDGVAQFVCSGDSQEPERVRQALLEHARRLCREGVPEEALLRLKRSFLGMRVRELDRFGSLCDRLPAYALCGLDYYQFPEILESITAQEITDFLRANVDPENISMTVLLPR